VSSYDVQIWRLGHRQGRARSYRVRWAVAGHRQEQGFTTRLLADSFRADLLRAAKNGEAFDEETGLPISMAREAGGRSWYDHARAYVALKWPNSAPKTRRSIVEALVTVTVAMVTDRRGSPSPDLVRSALQTYALTPARTDQKPNDESASALRWIRAASLPVSALSRPEVIRRALDACAHLLDGRPAAATTARRKRAVLYNALGYAVERGLLESNPIDRVQWRTPVVAGTVDRRVVANTAQIESILAVLPRVVSNGQRLVAFYACLYYAGMRPSEAVALRVSDCDLPRRGWGRLVFSETAPRSGAAWTDGGAAQEVRGLKRRGKKETRAVPIPPELVSILRAHIAALGIEEDDPLFPGHRGRGYLSDSVYDRAWKKARAEALSDRQVASPLATRPYDLRHAAVSLWLNGGVPATEVARRAGHSVAMLLSVYANCIDGEDDVVNARIEKALRAGRTVGKSGAGSATTRGQRHKTAG
jgi:integrase